MNLPIDPMATTWAQAVQTTWTLMMVAVGIALMIGLPAAFFASVARSATEPSDRLASMIMRLWVLASLLVMATPLILHAAAWESTAGKFGWLLKTQTGGNLLWVGWIHGVQGAAIVALTSFWGTTRLTGSAKQQAQLDYGLVGQWFRVRLPLALPWLVGGIVMVALLASTEMSVADLHSVRTTADQFYLFYALDPTATALAMASWIPLLVGGLPVVGWWWLRSRTDASESVWEPDPNRVDRAGEAAFWISRRWKIASLAVCVVVTGLLVAPMLLGLVIQAGHSVQMVDGVPRASWSLISCLSSLWAAPSLFAREYAWTVQLAGFTALMVVPLAWWLAAFGHFHNRWGMLFDVTGSLLFIIPGPLVAVAVVRLFASSMLPMGELLATQTLIPTMLAVGVRSGIIAYFLCRIGYTRITPRVWQAAQLDGGFWWRLINVHWPLMRRSLWLATVAVLIVASGDIPAILPVLPPGVTTVGTRLFGLLHSGSRYQEASLAFWYVLAVLLIGLLGWRMAALRPTPRHRSK